MASTSKKPARAKAKKSPKKTSATPNIRAVATNPCDDQNGVLLCWGGHVTSVPLPTTGGPWMPVFAINSQTGLMELQFADLTTLCPGNVAQMTAAPCRPCGESLDVVVQGAEAPPLDVSSVEQVSESEATNS